MASKPEMTFDFDRKSDVLYISLNTGEPSFSEEVDDMLLVEKGLYSGFVTGFRIFDVKEHGITGVRVKLLLKVFKQATKQIQQQLQQRNEMGEKLERKIGKELHNLLSA